MTIRMQESEAAADFSRFLAHLKAGDQVQLEAGNEPVGTVSFDVAAASRPGNIDSIVRALHQREEQHGPLVVADGYTREMRKVHTEFNQPWEPQDRWD